MGLPIGMRFSTERTRDTVDHIVVSVGPYKFHNVPHRGIISLANSGGIASPPHSTFSPSRPCQPLSRSMRQVIGVACITVALLSCKSWRNARPSRAMSRPAMTAREPAISGRKISSPAISKENVVTATRVSLADNPGSRAMDWRKFTSERCSICTPLGRPVEPDVNIT